MHGYVVKPWNYEPGKKYPVAFLIHGGPQGSFGNGWSYRWNPQTYAGAGLRGGDDRLPRLDRLRPGVHRRDHAALGRPPARGPAEGLGGGAGAVSASSTATRPARSAPATAATWSTGSPATGSSRGSASSTTTASSTTRMMGYATEELWFTEWENGGTPCEQSRGLREVQPDQPRQGLEACRCWSCTASRTSASRSSRASRAFTALQRKGIRVEVPVLPGREPLGAQAAEQRAVARHRQCVAEGAHRPVVRQAHARLEQRKSPAEAGLFSSLSNVDQYRGNVIVQGCGTPAARRCSTRPGNSSTAPGRRAPDCRSASDGSLASELSARVISWLTVPPKGA